MKFSHNQILVVAFSLLFSNILTVTLGQSTRAGFYSSTCSRVESIVQATVRKHFNSNRAIAPGLLRMHFHDCFVQGCDGSILIDGPNTEKTAPPNLLLRGYEVIDDAKQQIEAVCPGIVSCADILALAARDSVVLTGGPSWSVPLGRRDGRVSQASDTSNLPAFTDSVVVQKQKFEAKGLNTQDLVTLVGGHTIGTTACQFFNYRLYNFTSNGNADPTISTSLLNTLQSLCPADGDGTKRIGLDNSSENQFDNLFFRNVREGRGVLESDQRLWGDDSTKTVVQLYLGIRGFLGLRFNVEFGKSMVKMGNVEVKTGSDGEIRKVCSAIN